MIKHILAFLLGVIMISVFNSCNNVNSFTLGEDIVDIKSNVIFTDTCTIRSFTFKMDSVITSGTGVALVGRYVDTNMGNITINASTYFQVGLPSLPTFDPALTYVFDSLTLCLHNSHYVYGDTTKVYTIGAYRLTERINDKVPRTGYLYNTSRVAYDPVKLGETSLKPRYVMSDSVGIRLSDALGKELFSKIQNQDIQLSNSLNFLDYFKGFALVPGNSNNCVLGFNAYDTSKNVVYMRLNYHQAGFNYFIDFKLTNGPPPLQFNRIQTDFSTSTQKDLNASTFKKQEDMVSSILTDNQTFCQAGTGFVTRLEFPYINKLLEAGTIKILKAELSLAPVMNTYNLIPLPPKLGFDLNLLNSSNASKGALTNPNGYPKFLDDSQYKEQTAFVYDVTDYVRSVILQNPDEAPAIGVSITTSSNLYFNTLDRVIWGDRFRNSNITKLKILYWRY